MCVTFRYVAVPGTLRICYAACVYVPAATFLHCPTFDLRWWDVHGPRGPDLFVTVGLRVHNLPVGPVDLYPFLNALVDLRFPLWLRTKTQRCPARYIVVVVGY